MLLTESRRSDGTKIAITGRITKLSSVWNYGGWGGREEGFKTGDQNWELQRVSCNGEGG